MEPALPGRKKVDPTAPHKFWDTQPVPRLSESTDTVVHAGEGEINPDHKVEDVQQEPYKIPEAYEWFNPDVLDDNDITQLYELLAGHYVEDDDSVFRFAYPKDFLVWALTPPGWLRDWHIGIRVRASKKMVAFISGIPAKLRVRDNVITVTEINFLCVHKQIRSKRLAPVLIKEVTRRVNLQNIWQAVYTAGIVLPRPISSCQYWHRSLNPQKLISIGFSRIPYQFEKFQRPMEMTKRHFALPDKTALPLRPMKEADVPKVLALLSKYLERFVFAPHFEEHDIKHWFLPRDGVVNAYVVEKDGAITDFVSFYTLPSTVIGNAKYSLLKAAYSYYNVATTTDIVKLMNDALILARNLDFDVFNALDLMENAKFVRELKFGIGDGHLQYYLFNYRFPDVEPKDMALVLL
uniref:Glycylpeptide N-tetradecanoyltransferase n=1 Tax=Euglena longa TaxID=3037 RepID=A0A2R4IKY2_EUGLO|nr:N-myristoyltransferase [Euglena longa]